MSLTEKIASDLINAMKAKDKVSLEAIRAAKRFRKRSYKRRRTEDHSEAGKTEERIRCNLQGSKQAGSL
jgi:uncharacterized protein YqeY